MTVKIHYHSDCSFFSGSENMLVNFWSSSDLRENYDISFSYCASPAYTQGMYKRSNIDFPVYEINFPGSLWLDSELSHWMGRLKRIGHIISRLLFGFPIFIFEVFTLTKLFYKVQPQILHINNGGYPGALSCRSVAVAAKICRVDNVIMVVNNIAVPYAGFKRWLDFPIDRLVVLSVEIFVTGSLVAAAQLQKVLKLPSSKITSLHNGILLRSPNKSPEETRNRLGVKSFDGLLIGIVAIIERRKGHHVLIEAIRKIVSEKPDTKIKLLIEGEGSDRKNLEELVAVYKLSDYIYFIGEEENVIDFISILDVMVLPSISHEDFPNVILEAMGLGKAVIASRIAGTPEQVEDGVTGNLVLPDNVNSLVDALMSLIENPELIENYGKNAKECFQKMFTAEIAVDRYLRLYKKMMGDRI